MSDFLRILLENAGFLTVALLYVAWAQWRTQGDARFPGPAPVGSIFKAWFVVIWLVGILLPLVALVWEGVIGGADVVWLALGPYLLMFVAQVATEIFTWRRLGSPVWVIVPCLFLPWRLYQVVDAKTILQGQPLPITSFALGALFILWLINIGVHFTNIPNAMRWGFHPANAVFPSLKDARVVMGNEDQ